MQQVTYFEVNPGGNITAIVRGVFSIKERRLIAKKILSANKKVEQVGFWVPARSEKAIARLEMVGGEFCGNATRCLAVLTGRKGSFVVETSGLPDPVEVCVSKNSASVTIPTKFFQLKSGTCALPGITHVLTSRRLIPRKAKELLSAKKLLLEDAAGVIGCQNVKDDAYEIFPTVWVRDMKTLISETACASGSMALAYERYKAAGVRTLRIKQPSGSIFRTSIKSGKLTLDGPIVGIVKKTVAV